MFKTTVRDGLSLIRETRKNALQTKRLCKECLDQIEKLLSILDTDFIGFYEESNTNILFKLFTDLVNLRQQTGINVYKVDSQKLCYSSIKETVLSYSNAVDIIRVNHLQKYASKIRARLETERVWVKGKFDAAHVTSIECLRDMKLGMSDTGTQRDLLGSRRLSEIGRAAVDDTHMRHVKYNFDLPFSEYRHVSSIVSEIKKETAGSTPIIDLTDDSSAMKIDDEDLASDDLVPSRKI